MTRQELEKKKGVKLSQRDASPAEALISSINTDVSSTSKEASLTASRESADATKKDLKTRHYSIRLPEDMAEDMNLAKIVYGDIAKYVRTLIQKDMEKNRAGYAEIKARADSLF